MGGGVAARRPLVVILRALGLGDYLTGVPALRAVARAFPNHRRVLAAPEALAPLVMHVGAVDALAPTAGLVALDRSLAWPDVAIDLHGRGPGSQPLLLALQPRRLVAFAHAAVAGTEGGPPWIADEHEVRRWCRLLEESGIPADASDLAIDPPPQPGPRWAAGATVVHPGAASEARRWPAARFAAVAGAERRRGRVVVVTGGRGEEALAGRVAAAAGLPSSWVLAGRTSLLDLAAVVAGAGRVVCGDTGVGHLATALGVPSVLLFGPVPPALWGPPPGPLHVALWKGRRGDPHATRPDPGLLGITVEEVLRAVDALPTPQGAPFSRLGA